MKNYPSIRILTAPLVRVQVLPVKDRANAVLAEVFKINFMKTILKKILGASRLIFNFCPSCNDDAPHRQGCPVCRDGKEMMVDRKLNWERFKRMDFHIQKKNLF